MLIIMSHNNPTACPTWCDSSECLAYDGTTEHLEAPAMVVLDHDSDRTLLVGRTRVDETGMFEIPGAEAIRLEIHVDGGTPLNVDLLAVECRQLASLLLEAADRLPAPVAVAA